MTYGVAYDFRTATDCRTFSAAVAGLCTTVTPTETNVVSNSNTALTCFGSDFTQSTQALATGLP